MTDRAATHLTQFRGRIKPHQYERIVFLFFVKECTAEEVAYVLDIPLESVRASIVQETTNMREIQKQWT